MEGSVKEVKITDNSKLMFETDGKPIELKGNFGVLGAATRKG